MFPRKIRLHRFFYLENFWQRDENLGFGKKVFVTRQSPHETSRLNREQICL